MVILIIKFRKQNSVETLSQTPAKTLSKHLWALFVIKNGAGVSSGAGGSGGGDIFDPKSVQTIIKECVFNVRVIKKKTFF